MSINGLFVFHKMPKIHEAALVYGLVDSYYNAPTNQPEIYTGVICWNWFALERTFTFMHLADAFIQSDFQERVLQKCIGHWS